VDSAEQPKDFRPISLVHSFAKLALQQICLLSSRRGIWRYLDWLE
jgi:hypothetical protein